MNILLITDSYPPEIRSASLMMEELAQGLAAQGHKISIVTSLPRYNLAGALPPGRRIFSREIHDGIRVFRFPTFFLHNVTHFKRGVGQLLLPLIFALGCLFIGKIDFSIVYSPPLTLGLTAYFMKMIQGSKFIFNVQDLFPQNAIDLKVLTNKYLIKIFRCLEKFIYKKSRFITVHSQGNREYILNIGIAPEKVVVIPNWVDIDKYVLKKSGNVLPKELRSERLFIVLFAGIMGYAQDMDIIVKAAQYLKNHSDIVFLLVGDGSEKAKTAAMKNDLGLDNLILLPFIPLEDYPALVVRCDVGLVTLKKSMRTPVVPSKILGYMAAGKPIIASLNKESEARWIINEARAGLVNKIETPLNLAEAVLKLYHDPMLKKRLGENGKNYVSGHFHREKSLALYGKLFRLM